MNVYVIVTNNYNGDVETAIFTNPFDADALVSDCNSGDLRWVVGKFTFPLHHEKLADVIASAVRNALPTPTR